MELVQNREEKKKKRTKGFIQPDTEVKEMTRHVDLSQIKSTNSRVCRECFCLHICIPAHVIFRFFTGDMSEQFHTNQEIHIKDVFL